MFSFASQRTLSFWRPSKGRRLVLLRWLMTEWCNYRCPYCPQTHARYEPKGENLTAHAFDNFPLSRWQDAITRHFGDDRLTLVITGGEPMLDRKNVVPLLNWLSDNPLVECIRIDTNLSWKAHLYADLAKDKIILMCTFHPSEVEEEKFIARLLEARAAGYRVGIVNYVMNETNRHLFRARHQRFFNLGFVLHPNPLWDRESEEDLAVLKEYLPPLDYAYRTRLKKPKGKPCHFPVLAYELDYTGNVHPGCYPSMATSFFADKLPSLAGPSAPCPAKKCVCLDKYSFLKGVERNTTADPLSVYALMLHRIAEAKSHKGF